jgi:hypothetical protein
VRCAGRQSRRLGGQRHRSNAVYERNDVLEQFAKICWQLRIEYDLFHSLLDLRSRRQDHADRERLR